MSRRLPDVPADDAWLTATERDTLAGLHVPKRRNDWRLGRWTAKAAVVAWLTEVLPGRAPPLGSVEIQPAEDGAPEAFVGGEAAPVSISITHRAERGVVAVAARGVALGCDLEIVEERRSVFLEDFFTDAEVAAVRGLPEAGQPEAVTRLWAAKEAALKALREGLRIDTRTLEVHPLVPAAPGEASTATSGRATTSPRWEPMRTLVASHGLAHADWARPGGSYQRSPLTLAGWWCRVDDGLLAVVADPPTPYPPRPL